MQGEIGIAQHLARHRHDISQPLLQNKFRLRGIDNDPDGAGGNLHFLANASCKLNLITSENTTIGLGQCAARGAIDKVDTELFQFFA